MQLTPTTEVKANKIDTNEGNQINEDQMKLVPTNCFSPK